MFDGHRHNRNRTTNDSDARSRLAQIWTPVTEDMPDHVHIWPVKA